MSVKYKAGFFHDLYHLSVCWQMELFGLATMADVELFASHINDHNSRTELIAEALYRHGDHFSSFMSLVDNGTNVLLLGVRDKNAHEI